jgi:hypothetical protein
MHSVWICVLFTFIPNHKINERSIVAVIFLFKLVDTLIYPVWFFHPDLYTYAWGIYLVVMYVSLRYVSKRSYQYPSDPIKDNNVYICLWKPEKTASLFESLIGAPIGSVCLYAGGSMYSFRWGSHKYIKKEVFPSVVLRKFIVVDSGVPADDKIIREIENLLGTPARSWRTLWFRCRCILIIKPVLVQMGETFRPRLFEFVPSLYAARLLRSRGKNG